MAALLFRLLAAYNVRMGSTPAYDDHYLAGIQFFNAGDFFEAHEVWEELWHVSTNPERRFYQGMIQTAVALFHLGNRNARGAVRLFHSSRDYLTPSRPRFLGLDVDALFQAMERCFAPHLQSVNLPGSVAATDLELPQLRLDPPPEHWPDPELFLPEEEEDDHG